MPSFHGLYSCAFATILYRQLPSISLITFHNQLNPRDAEWPLIASHLPTPPVIASYDHVASRHILWLDLLYHSRRRSRGRLLEKDKAHPTFATQRQEITAHIQADKNPPAYALLVLAAITREKAKGTSQRKTGMALPPLGETPPCMSSHNKKISHLLKYQRQI